MAPKNKSIDRFLENDNKKNRNQLLRSSNYKRNSIATASTTSTSSTVSTSADPFSDPSTFSNFQPTFDKTFDMKQEDDDGLSIGSEEEKWDNMSFFQQEDDEWDPNGSGGESFNNMGEEDAFRVIAVTNKKNNSKTTTNNNKTNNNSKTNNNNNNNTLPTPIQEEQGWSADFKQQDCFGDEEEDFDDDSALWRDIDDHSSVMQQKEMEDELYEGVEQEEKEERKQQQWKANFVPAAVETVPPPVVSPPPHRIVSSSPPPSRQVSPPRTLHEPRRGVMLQRSNSLRSMSNHSQVSVASVHSHASFASSSSGSAPSFVYRLPWLFPGTLQQAEVAATKRQQHKKKKAAVAFSTVQVREFERTISDNPAAVTGPSVGIGWRFRQHPPCLLRAMRRRQPPSRGTQLIMSKDERVNLLMSIGYRRCDVAASVRANNRIKKQRKQTIDNMRAEGMEEMVEGFVRVLSLNTR